MSTIDHTFRDECTAYNDQLDQNLPMPLAAWKALKTVLYVGLIGGITWLSITAEADPTIIGALALSAIILVFGFEVKEIEIANLLTITLKNGSRQDREKRPDGGRPVPRGGALLLNGSATIGLVAWAKDLTYKEVHAMAYGTIHGVGIVAAYAVGLPEVSVGLVVAAFALLGWVNSERTKDVPLVSTILGAIPATIKGQIRDEQHYYGTLLLGSAVVAAVVYAFLP